MFRTAVLYNQGNFNKSQGSVKTRTPQSRFPLTVFTVIVNLNDVQGKFELAVECCHCSSVVPSVFCAKLCQLVFRISKSCIGHKNDHKSVKPQQKSCKTVDRYTGKISVCILYIKTFSYAENHVPLTFIYYETGRYGLILPKLPETRWFVSRKFTGNEKCTVQYMYYQRKAARKCKVAIIFSNQYKC